MTHQPVMVGLLNVATFAPIFLLSMLGGMLSDRFDRRAVVVATQLFSLVVAATITVLTATGTITAPLLIMLAALLGCSYALAKPALAALLPSLVDRDEIAHAIAVNTMQFNLGQVGGSALSALLLALTSPTVAFALNTLSFAGPILSMIALRRVAMPGAACPGSLRGSGREGFRLVLRSPAMVTLLGAVALSNAAVEGLRTLAPELTSRIRGSTASSAGVLVMTFGLGATVGLLLFGWASRHISPARLQTIAFSLQVCGLLGVALARRLVPAALLAAPIGVGFALTIPVLNAGLQVLSPDDFRGRVMSQFSMVHLGLRPVFSLTAGGLATLVDARWALLLFIAFPLLALSTVTRASRAVGRARARSTPHPVDP